MKVLIIENEFEEIKGAFAGLKVLLDNKFEYTQISSSQGIGIFDEILNYDLIFVDLDLIPSSKLTGYEILKDLQELDAPKIPLIYVITGHGNAKEELARRGIENVPILEKPFGLKNLRTIIEPLIK